MQKNPSGRIPRQQRVNGGQPRSRRVRKTRKSLPRPLKATSVAVPVAYNTTIGSYKNNQPRITSAANCTTIQNEEFFTTLASTGTAYNAVSLPCNPGMPDMFPWLSGIALQYEKYRFRKLVFHYITRAATSTTGNAVMVFDFDAMDPAPTDFLSACAYKDKMVGCAWKDGDMAIDLADDRALARYNRPGLPAAPYDLKTYDLGQLIIASEGAAAATLGIVGVEYIVELYTPQVGGPVAGSQYATAGLDATHLVGTNPVADSQGWLPWTNVASDGTASSQYLYAGTASWAGMVVVAITGVGLAADFTPNAVGSFTFTIMNQYVDATATHVLVYARVIISGRSVHIHPSMTATSVSQVLWRAAKGDYNSLTY